MELSKHIDLKMTVQAILGHLVLVDTDSGIENELDIVTMSDDYYISIITYCVDPLLFFLQSSGYLVDLSQVLQVASVPDHFACVTPGFEPLNSFHDIVLFVRKGNDLCSIVFEKVTRNCET